ncbi:lipid II flippase MurJ [Pollutimonas thiosulfatoxidans]|uniref:lipid II flippase MurJ n=1 Tax=Pollutimonas thiosulfatoxidans TaxID=2028345 RepID=UPI0013E3B19C|nr:lipid II flippase MurJ [Pollutimonas thiosulfatoxidans]
MIVTRKLLGSTTLILGLALLAGRASGFVREVLIARELGLSAQADIAVILLTLPDLFVNILLAGGLTAALVPRLSVLSSSARSKLFWQSTVFAAAVFTIIALIVGAAPDSVLALIAPGYVGALDEQARFLFAVVCIAIPFTALSGISTALLNSQGRFFLAGTGTLIFNVIVIGGVVIGSSRGQTLVWLACAIAMGAFVRYGSQLLGIIDKVEFRIGRALYFDRRLGASFTYALIATSATLLVPVLMRSLATLLGSGSLAGFSYATKIVELPIGILITTFGTVALPRLSRMVDAADTGAAVAFYNRSCAKATGLAIAIAIPAIIVSRTIVGLVLGEDSFSAADLNLISELVRIGLIGLPLVAVSSMATAALNAQGRQNLLLKRTALSAMFLPFLVVPGLVLDDIRLLMVALVAFQAILAFSLWKLVKQKKFEHEKIV